ncbi:hypothetical protein FACS1894174_00190 [Bacteroidia bacterium]|nr:hypothetical protein FACS1894174_00190 [Bacteroidia bacterium]
MFMKNLKYLINTVFLLIGMIGFSSCLESDLDELPAYSGADITDFYFEYRYEVKRSDGVTDIKYMRMSPVGKQISGESYAVTIRVPGVDGTFDETQRANVSLNNLVGYCYLSTAAKIEPIDGAPQLGNIGNFSSPVKYKVTAADGKTMKTWTVTVTLNR